MSWIDNLLPGRRMKLDLAEEIDSHLEERVAELTESGVPLEEARNRARREFGNPTILAEQGRAVWTWTWL